jgi:hypothetical protein
VVEGSRKLYEAFVPVGHQLVIGRAHREIPNDGSLSHALRIISSASAAAYKMEQRKRRMSERRTE